MFLSKIKTAQPRLMVLLDNRYLRPATVDLISLLSQDASGEPKRQVYQLDRRFMRPSSTIRGVLDYIFRYERCQRPT